MYVMKGQSRLSECCNYLSRQDAAVHKGSAGLWCDVHNSMEGVVLDKNDPSDGMVFHLKSMLYKLPVLITAEVCKQEL